MPRGQTRCRVGGTRTVALKCCVQGSMIKFAVLALSIISHVHCGKAQQIKKSERISEEEEEKAEQRFFDAIDENKNGGLDKSEIKKYIANEIGSKHFDEETEIDGGVERMMSQVDTSKGGTVSARELDSHWSAKESYLTVHAVADWVAKGLQLPQVPIACSQPSFVPSLLFINVSACRGLHECDDNWFRLSVVGGREWQDASGRTWHQFRHNAQENHARCENETLRPCRCTATPELASPAPPTVVFHFQLKLGTIGWCRSANTQLPIAAHGWTRSRSYRWGVGGGAI